VAGRPTDLDVDQHGVRFRIEKPHILGRYAVAAGIIAVGDATIVPRGNGPERNRLRGARHHGSCHPERAPAQRT
jgi:hypothetical protein